MGGTRPLSVIALEQVRIGIVTVLYNSENVLEDFFRTLDRQTYRDFSLYVIDNHSPDNSLDRARELAATVRFRTEIIAEPENWGVAKGNNIGIVRALAEGCEYVLLSNNDIVLEPDTLEKYTSERLKRMQIWPFPKFIITERISFGRQEAILHTIMERLHTKACDKRIGDNTTGQDGSPMPQPVSC